ncbi:MAG: hypothetical protein EOP53_27465 [Sphingobacteriales bacterium]|nr:MAG: hypothetical protein EOP53_27465 [Sphingobacteriales bacterium]
MKKLLIIYPHFPPSNLAGVHRPRLFAQHLPSFGWIPTVLTVHEDFYEERLDPDLLRLLPDNLRIEKVNALPLTKPRIIGDLGLRAFFSLYKKAREMIRSEGFDFLLIPIPSFYTALLGRWLCSSTGIKYGIDYIDPWVHRFPGTDRLFSRHWWSTQIANLLEPIAVKKAALITGVAKGYYESVLERSPRLKKTAFTGAMPYGVEKGDMEKLYKTGKKPYLFQSGSKIRLVYAGAMLPKAFAPLEEIMAEIAKNRKEFADIEFYFIAKTCNAFTTALIFSEVY